MTDDDVARQIIGIIADQAMLDPAEVRPDASPEQLGLDSLALVEIVFAIEERFDISVPYNANDPTASDFDIGSVEKIVAAVRRLIAEKA
jgi:acyl carrier protein